MYRNVALIATIFASFILLCNAECPKLYQRYSKDHTYCKPANTSCQFIDRYITKAEEKIILDEHNKYRSKIAQGKETIGNLPPATAMMQLEWDDELAANAQKHADQCLFEHDCNECRQVFNFRVGQNMWTSHGPLPPTRDIGPAIGSWIKEVKDFQRPIIDKFDTSGVKAIIGHFTELIWAESWKIGCGYTAFKVPEGVREQFTCNYGPGGNIKNRKIYETGKTCSGCPLNSVCQKSEYPGLCKMSKSDQQPEYKRTFPSGKKLLFCDFSEKNNCPVSSDSTKWMVMRSLSGSFTSIVLQGGESSTLNLEYTVKSPGDTCISLQYRLGPDKDGDASKGEGEIQLIANGTPTPIPITPQPHPTIFNKFQMNLPWGGTEYKLAVKFSVPSGSPAQFLEFTDILVMEGPSC